MGARQGAGSVSVVVQGRGAFIEGDDYIGPQLLLDPDRDLRGETMGGTVERGGESDPFIIDLGQLRAGGTFRGLRFLAGKDLGDLPNPVFKREPEAEALKPAAIGEDGAIPAHE